jgi:hypothetical protein
MTDEDAKISHTISESLLTALNTLENGDLNFIFGFGCVADDFE